MVVRIVRDSILILFCSTVLYHTVLYCTLSYPTLPYHYYSSILLENCYITTWYKMLYGEVRGFGKQVRGGNVRVRSNMESWDVYFLFLLHYSRKVVNITGSDYCLCFRFNVQLRLIRRRFLRTARSWSIVLIADGKGKGLS